MAQSVNIRKYSMMKICQSRPEQRNGNDFVMAKTFRLKKSIFSVIHFSYKKLANFGEVELSQFPNLEHSQHFLLASTKT